MSEREDEENAGEVRVIDPEVTDQEVIKLEQQKPERLEKKGKIEVVSLTNSLASDKLVETEAAQSQDLEEIWEEEAELRKVRSVPFGWFVLLGAVLLGVFLWVFVQGQDRTQNEVIIGPDGPDGRALLSAQAVSVMGEKPLGKLEEERANQNAAEHYAETDRVVRHFFAAETVSEMAKVVRHRERVLPLMETHYRDRAIHSVPVVNIKKYQIVALDKRPFIALQVLLDNGEMPAVLLEDSPEGQKIDWESFVGYQSMDLDQFVSERISSPVTVRAYVQPDYFHSRDFIDKEEFQSYLLTFRDSELVLNGYVRREGQLFEKFRRLFPGRSRSRKLPLTLDVRYLEGGESPHSVLIDDLVSVKWAYSTDPTKAAR